MTEEVRCATPPVRKRYTKRVRTNVETPTEFTPPIRLIYFCVSSIHPQHTDVTRCDKIGKDVTRTDVTDARTSKGKPDQQHTAKGQQRGTHGLQEKPNMLLHAH